MNRFLSRFSSNRIFSLLLLLAACGAFCASLILQLQTGGVHAGMFPLAVSSVFLLSAVLNVIFAFRAADDRPQGSLSKVLWMCVLLLGAGAALLLHVPFYVICPVFLFVSSFVILKQSWIASLIAAAAATGLVYLLFAVLFRLPLP